MTNIGLALLVGGLTILAPLGVGRQESHHFAVAKCHDFFEVTGYQTKFVDYNFFDWDCLARTAGGMWTSYGNLRKVD